MSVMGKLVAFKSKVVPTVMVVGTSALASVSAFAAEPSEPSVVDSISPAITEDMLTPIVEAIQSNVAVILPVGIVIMGVMVAITLVPKIFKKFLS